MSDRVELHGSELPGRGDEILAARDVIRAQMAPTSADLERLLMKLHRQSARSQRKARQSQQRAREALYERLGGKVIELDDTGAVVVAIVTTRELIGVIEAESNIVKTEAMAQRSYDVHRSVVAGVNPAAGSVEDFIIALEQEESIEVDPTGESETDSPSAER